MRYLLSLSAIVLFSCTSMKKQTKSDTGTGNPLAGTNWTMSSIPGFDLEHTPRPVTLGFADTTDRMGGNAGCNSFGGHYMVKGSTLKMEKIISTKMACMPGMQTESRVMNVMMTADHYNISGDKLTLKQGEKVLAEYVRSKKEQK
jgi:heat shock protein HslJ